MKHGEPGQHQDEKTIMRPLVAVLAAKPQGTVQERWEFQASTTQRIVWNIRKDMRKRWTYEEESLIERTYMQDSYWGCGKWEYLAEQFGVTTAQLKNHVDYMVKKGVLKKERKVREKRVNPNWWTDKEKSDLFDIMQKYQKGIWIKKAMPHLGKSQRSIYYMSSKLRLGQ